MSSRPIILNPCPADWNKMTPNQRGRHCGLCSKTVVDFTRASDEEILKAMRQSSEKLCARMNSRSPNRPTPQPLLNPEQTLGQRAWKKLQVFVLALAMVFAGQSCIYRTAGEPTDIIDERITITGTVRHLNGTDTLAATGAIVTLLRDSTVVMQVDTADNIGAYSFLNVFYSQDTFLLKAEYMGNVQYQEFTAQPYSGIFRFNFLFE